MNRFLIVLLSVFALCSCSDVLDTRLSTEVDSEELVTNVERLNLAVNGLYNNMQTPDYYNRSALLIPELLADNAMINIENQGRYLDYNNLSVNRDESRARDLWNNIYRSVASASIVIRQGKELEVSESLSEERDHYLGEAHAIRALGYLNLQLFYARPYHATPDASHPGILLVDEEKAGTGEVLHPHRSTTAEGFALIVDDLNRAIGLLGSSGGPFRINRHAARALLARTYMHMENWNDALELAEAVINEGGYTLVPHDDYAESWRADSSSESIFSINNTVTDNSGSDALSNFFYIGYEDGLATNDFVNSLSATDARLELYPYKDRYEAHIIVKYPRSEQSRDDKLPVVRLSELYLIKAEAHAQLGQYSQAQQALDAIIQRADPEAASSSETGEALLEKILLERRKELAFEGFRLFDLTRSRKSYTKFRHHGDTSPIDYPDNRTILPIPLDEINRNPSLGDDDQNPGY